MGKIQKMITGVAVTFLCGMAGVVSSITCLAAGESYNTATEAAYGDTFRSVYENRLASSPLEAEEVDGVDTATGHLMLSRNDLSLDGTGDMDFELNRYYDSNEANLGHVMDVKRYDEAVAEFEQAVKIITEAVILPKEK